MPGGTVACICRQGSAAADDTASLCSRVDSVQQHPHQEEQMLGVQNARSQLHWPSCADQSAAMTTLNLNLGRPNLPLPDEIEINAKPLNYARQADCLQLVERHLAATDNVVATDNEDVTSAYPSLKSPLRFLTNLFSFKRLSSKDSLPVGSELVSSGTDLETPPPSSGVDGPGRKVTNMKPRSPNPQRFYKTLETMKSLEKLYMSRADDPELQPSSNSYTSASAAPPTADFGDLDKCNSPQRTAGPKVESTSAAVVTLEGAASTIGTINGSRLVTSSESSTPAVLPDSHHLIRSPPPVHKTYLHVQGRGCSSPLLSSNSPRRIQSGYQGISASSSKPITSCRNTSVATEAIIT